MKKFLWILSGVMWLWVGHSAAQSPLTLALMSSQVSHLDATTPTAEWTYNPQGSSSTILVETLSGTLDPSLEVLNSEGVVVASNNDFAPAFSPAARVTLPPSESYTLRVSLVYGEGDYRITALPGTMHRQWDDDFTEENPFWQIPNATPVPNGIRLQTPLTTTRLFTPHSAPPLNDVYLQAAFRWGEVRAESEAGLTLRARTENNGQISGIRLAVTPQGAWSLVTNDGLGAENRLAEGTLAEVNDILQLGLLAQGDSIAAFADGIMLAEAQDTQFNARTSWGILIYDAQLVLEDFWLAIPALDPPLYPAQINAWASPQSLDIGQELIDAGVLPAQSERVFVLPQTNYTVNGKEQRNFLFTDENLQFDNFALGGDVIVQQGSDVGCGLVGRFQGRDNKILAYADTQGGAGLLWWEGGQINLNDYSMVENPNATENRLLLLVQGQYAAFYVNGALTAQALIPLRLGNVGVGFVNYASSGASCLFRNLWIWQ